MYRHMEIIDSTTFNTLTSVYPSGAYTIHQTIRQSFLSLFIFVIHEDAIYTSDGGGGLIHTGSREGKKERIL